MKKLLRWAIMPVVALAMSVAFTSCGSDDPEDADGSTLEGKWYCVEEKYTNTDYPEDNYTVKIDYKKENGIWYPKNFDFDGDFDLDDCEGFCLAITDLGYDQIRIKEYFCEKGGEWELDETVTGYVDNGMIYVSDWDQEMTITSLKGDKMTLTQRYGTTKSEAKFERK